MASMLRYLLMVAVLSACGSSGDDIEAQITIDQGVYGLLSSGCDTTDCQDYPAAGEQVLVYAAGSNGVFSQAKSDDNGVYQIDLVAGSYILCTYSCTPVIVPEHDTVRYDWVSGPGGGHWSTEP
jgi:hypothetical protein